MKRLLYGLSGLLFLNLALVFQCVAASTYPMPVALALAALNFYLASGFCLYRLARLSTPLVLLLTLAAPAVADGPVAPDGTPVQVDLPLSLRMKNTGGSDGSGLCVYSSVTMAAHYQGEARLFGLRQYAEKRPGGSWPEKLRKDLATFAPGAPVLQVTGCDLAFIRLCLDNGYLVSTTYGSGHMLNVVALTDKWACILDNNTPWGEGPGGQRVDTRLRWMTAAEFGKRASQGGGNWIVVVLEKGPPPPVPINGAQTPRASATSWTPPVYEWRHKSAYPGDLYLYRGGHLQGGWTRRYDPAGAYYPRRKAGQWLPAAPAPVPVPDPPRYYFEGETVVAAALDSGCRWQQGPEAAPKFTLGSQTVSRADAEALVVRYATARRLTVVGDADFRLRVGTDLLSAPELAAWKGQLLTQFYYPPDPLAKDVGLRPGITLQAPPGKDGKGKVLHYQPDWTGPAGLALALRRTDPGYDPAKDPDLSRPAPGPGPGPSPLAVGAADWGTYAPFGLLSLGAAALILTRSRKPKGRSPWPLS